MIPVHGHLTTPDWGWRWRFPLVYYHLRRRCAAKPPKSFWFWEFCGQTSEIDWVCGFWKIIFVLCVRWNSQFFNVDFWSHPCSLASFGPFRRPFSFGTFDAGDEADVLSGSVHEDTHRPIMTDGFIGGRGPDDLIFFRGGETTNQLVFGGFCSFLKWWYPNSWMVYICLYWKIMENPIYMDDLWGIEILGNLHICRYW